MTGPIDTLHLVDPQLRGRLEGWTARVLTNESLDAIRAGWMSMPVSLDDGVEVEEVQVPGPPGAPDVGLIVYRPAEGSGPLPVIMHFHGGGYIMGSARHFEASCRGLVSLLGCVVVSVDYRLAPETIFPGAIEDCYAALAWTYASASEWGFNTGCIGVMGESAGGGLAAALALLARDRGEFKLSFQHLISPMIDDRTCVTATPNPLTGQFIWTPVNNAFGWSSMLGHAPGIQGVSPYAAAARADDLSGLPPAYIHVGTLDLFLDEDMEYAVRLIQAGVPVEFHLWPGAFHGFDLAADTDIARRALGVSRDSLLRALSNARD